MNYIPVEDLVLKGLECCQDCDGYTCRNCCPYHDRNEPEDQPTCTCRLAHDALALLKAQEPRVMTLEEVSAIPYGHVLIETDKAGSLRWVDALLFSRNTNFTFDFITLEGRARLLGSEYGREWRVWTSRPTDEQREAVKWDP